MNRKYKKFIYCKVGLGDVFPHTHAGRYFLIFFAMVGLGLVAVLLTLLEGLMRDAETARELAIKVAKDKIKIQHIQTVRQITKKIYFSKIFF